MCPGPSGTPPDLASYVIQEAVVVVKDVVRRHPNQYAHLITTLLDDNLLEQLDEPDAKASIVWIIGEYTDRIPNAKQLITNFLSTFKDEAPQVQLQLLTAVVKLFLKNPESNQQMAQDTLTMATTEIDNPDIRDRAFIYWRLLSVCPDKAESVVCALKPLLSEESEKLDPPILDELISRISTLASVYHKPPAMFVRLAKQRLGQDSEEEEEVRNREEPESLLPPMGDLLGGGDLLGSTSSTPEVALPQLLSPQAENANGLQVNGKFFVNGENIELRLQITNHSGKVISGFLVKFKKKPIQPRASHTQSLHPIHITRPDSPKSPSLHLWQTSSRTGNVPHRCGPQDK